MQGSPRTWRWQRHDGGDWGRASRSDSAQHHVLGGSAVSRSAVFFSGVNCGLRLHGVPCLSSTVCRAAAGGARPSWWSVVTCGSATWCASASIDALVVEKWGGKMEDEYQAEKLE